jgi:hypothetical protein
MKTMASSLIGAFVLLWTASFALATENTKKSDTEATIRDMLPEPAGGFEWVVYRNSAFLKPKGWNQKSLPDQPDKKLIGALAISPESFSEKKYFEHGFTAQVAAEFKKTNKVEPSKGAMLILKPIADQHEPEEVLLFDSKPSQIGTTFVLRYRDAPAGKTPIIVHKYLIANDTADTLHIFTYESPTADWEDNWKKFGTPILQKIAVLPFLPATP